MTSIDVEYASILNELFKVAKNPPRHDDHDTIFAKRKQFFQQIYDQSNLVKKPKVIHVAGSKGKGSTVEYISCSLREDGYKVGVFTSPHLHSARERIKIGKQLISKYDLIRLGKIALDVTKDIRWGVVFFDLFLVIAIMYFSEMDVDYIVLETGIGGRYDSTNFIDHDTIVSVITSISMDHMAILGDTIEAIAYQKAGIIKRNCHVFTLTKHIPSVADVFRAEAMRLNATLHEISVDKTSNSSAIDDASYNDLFPAQQDNISLSCAVLKHLNVSTGKFFTSMYVYISLTHTSTHYN